MYMQQGAGKCIAGDLPRGPHGQTPGIYPIDMMSKLLGLSSQIGTKHGHCVQDS